MKFCLLTVALILGLSKCFSQDTTFTLSKYEKFNAQVGKIFKTETKEFGSIGASFNVAKAKTIEINSGNVMSAIKLYATSDPQIINPHVIYIDWEDLDSIINVIEFLSKEADNLTKSRNGFFYTYNAPNDVQISFSYPTAVFSSSYLAFSRIFKNSRTIMPGSFLYVTKKRMHDLVDLLKKANTNEF